MLDEKLFEHIFMEDSPSESSAGNAEDVNSDNENCKALKKEEENEAEAVVVVDEMYDELPVCVVCGGTPCQWDEFGGKLMEQANQMFEQTTSLGDDGTTVTVLLDRSTGEIVDNRTARFKLYQMFTYLKYGHLGKGNRICLP